MFGVCLSIYIVKHILFYCKLLPFCFSLKYSWVLYRFFPNLPVQIDYLWIEFQGGKCDVQILIIDKGCWVGEGLSSSQSLWKTQCQDWCGMSTWFLVLMVLWSAYWVNLNCDTTYLGFRIKIVSGFCRMNYHLLQCSHRGFKFITHGELSNEGKQLLPQHRAQCEACPCSLYFPKIHPCSIILNGFPLPTRPHSGTCAPPNLKSGPVHCFPTSTATRDFPFLPLRHWEAQLSPLTWLSFKVKLTSSILQEAFPDHPGTQ